MEAQILVNPRLLVERLEQALNDHDIDTVADCFDPLYFGEQPVHPERAFRGRDRVRTDWSTAFKNFPNFKANVTRCSVDNDTVWVEWHMQGTQKDTGAKLDLLGVSILGIREQRVVWSRNFVEPIQKPGAGIEAVTR